MRQSQGQVCHQWHGAVLGFQGQRAHGGHRTARFEAGRRLHCWAVFEKYIVFVRITRSPYDFTWDEATAFAVQTPIQPGMHLPSETNPQGSKITSTVTLLLVLANSLPPPRTYAKRWQRRLLLEAVCMTPSSPTSSCASAEFVFQKCKLRVY